MSELTQNMHHEFLEKITVVFAFMGCDFRIITSIIFHFNATLLRAFDWDNWEKTCIDNFRPRIRTTCFGHTRLDMWRSGIRCFGLSYSNKVQICVSVSFYKQRRHPINFSQCIYNRWSGKSIDTIFRSLIVLRWFGKFNFMFWYKIFNLYNIKQEIGDLFVVINDNMSLHFSIGRLNIQFFGTREYYSFNPFDPNVSTLFSFLQENANSETNTKKAAFQLYSICKESENLHGQYSREYCRLLNL